jgi:PAT family beta-lactamase induction signal transducer AmpG
MVSRVGVPLVDRLPIPLLTRLLGRRRSWLPLVQSSWRSSAWR